MTTDIQAIKEDLTTVLAQLDEDRGALKESRKRAVKFLLGGVVSLIAGIILFIFLKESDNGGWTIGVMVISVIYIFGVLSYFYSKWQALKLKIKQLVLSRVVQSIHPSMTFDAQGYISYNDFRATGLFRSPDRYSGEDLIEGMHGDTRFRISEVHAEERRTTRDSNGNTRTTYHTIFKGLVMIADFNKHIHGSTFVLPDHIEKFGISWLTKGLQKWSGRGKLVYLENIEFEKEFVVYSTDQVEARYILTPTMMESILALRSRFDAPVNLSFTDNHVAICISSNSDFLEPDIYDDKPLLESEWIENLVGEIHGALGIIDQLDLNTRIWTKN